MLALKMLFFSKKTSISKTKQKKAPYIDYEDIIRNTAYRKWTYNQIYTDNKIA